jgi:hypothetical protein
MHLNEALLFRDCLEQTIAEGIHTMRQGNQSPESRNYAAFLEAARGPLLEGQGAIFGGPHHAFIREALRKADEAFPGGVSSPGAWQAQTFLQGFSEGVRAVADFIRNAPLMTPGQATYTLLDLARQHGLFAQRATADEKPGRRHAYLVFARELVEGVDATKATLQEVERETGRHDHPLFAVCEALWAGLGSVFEQKRNNPPFGLDKPRWPAWCEEAHLRMRSFISGAVRALALTHPELARSRAWALPVQAGRLAPSVAEATNNWWVGMALGILAELRCRLYWNRPDGIETRQAEAFVLAFAQQAHPAPQLAARLAKHVARDPLEERIRSWVLGAAVGARRARVLAPGDVERSWVRSLKSALPSLDVDQLLEGVDSSQESVGPCGHGKAHHIYQELVERFCRTRGVDSVLPEQAEDAYVLGFLRGHHLLSLPHKHHHD